MNGADFLVKAILERMDESTRNAILQIPGIVQTVSARVANIEASQARIEQFLADQAQCKKLDAVLSMLERIQGAVIPGFTPDEPLPTLENVSSLSHL